MIATGAGPFKMIPGSNKKKPSICWVPNSTSLSFATCNLNIMILTATIAIIWHSFARLSIVYFRRQSRMSVLVCALCAVALHYL
jgi:hypothetical protein